MLIIQGVLRIFVVKIFEKIYNINPKEHLNTILSYINQMIIGQLCFWASSPLQAFKSSRFLVTET